MFRTLYIVKDKSKEWYQVRTSESHVCVCFGESLDTVLVNIKNLVIKYKTELKLIRSLSNTSEAMRVPKNEYLTLDKYYKMGGHLVYADQVEKAVREGLEIVKFDTPVLKNRKIFKTISIPTTPIVREESVKLVVKPVKKPVLRFTKLKI